MIRSTLLIASFFVCTIGRAQTEIIIPWSGNLAFDSAVAIDTVNVNLNGISHVVDDSGNIYLLGSISTFSNDPGIVIDGATYLGLRLIKISSNDQLLWKSDVNNYTNYVPGSPMFSSGDRIYLPFIYCMNPYFNGSGQSPECVGSGNMCIYRENGKIDSYKLLDTSSNGNVCKYFFDKSLVFESINLIRDFSSGLNYYYRIMILNRNLDSVYSFISPTIDNINSVVRNIVYDTSSHMFIATKASGVYVFSDSLVLINSIELPYANNNYTDIKIAMSDLYYAINYTYNLSGSNKQIAYLAIYDKHFKLVSCKSSASFSDILLTNENYLLAIASNNSPFGADTGARPIQFVQMDIHQNVLRRSNIGSLLSSGNRLSITSSNDIIITGSVFYSNPTNSHYTVTKNIRQSPDCIYYYRQNLKDIPLLSEHPLNSCDNVATYPNPANSTIRIVSNVADTTESGKIELFDLFGKKMMESDWRTDSFDLNLSTFPNGIYIVQITKNNLSCPIKVEKQ